MKSVPFLASHWFVRKQSFIPFLPRTKASTITRGLSKVSRVVSGRAWAPAHSPLCGAHLPILGTKPYTLCSSQASRLLPQKKSPQPIYNPAGSALFLSKLTLVFSNTTHNSLDFVPEISENKATKVRVWRSWQLFLA